MGRYQDLIAEVVGPEPPARLVEAFMRAERSTLDDLSPEQFADEAREAAICAAADLELAELLARSYGL